MEQDKLMARAEELLKQLTTEQLLWFISQWETKGAEQREVQDNDR